ncbi:hypothetical protein DLM78_08740 [Leptospira stimsonii]|uniref:Uncharacterized protein n=1 Tax=Leptospira stimsonii TaxID=2202203 RepID=A0A8B6RYC5_9LEPT|nr:hypothetical protein DLM78_08740 [Leptospira stimsonii]
MSGEIYETTPKDRKQKTDRRQIRYPFGKRESTCFILKKSNFTLSYKFIGRIRKKAPNRKRDFFKNRSRIKKLNRDKNRSSGSAFQRRKMSPIRCTIFNFFYIPTLPIVYTKNFGRISVISKFFLE